METFKKLGLSVPCSRDTRDEWVQIDLRQVLPAMELHDLAF